MLSTVFDTTILVSGFLTPYGLANQILSQARQGAFVLSLSERIIAETQAVLLESVRRLYQGLQSFRNMRRMEASLRKARALRLRFSQSLASLRQRFSQPMVRSTIQRLGRTTKPLIRSERFTIAVSRCGKMAASAV